MSQHTIQKMEVCNSNIKLKKNDLTQRGNYEILQK